MKSTKSRMIVVAVLVCGFAVGMAGLLNYFKYRSTVSHLVRERLVVTGKAIENSIQGSLGLGLAFSDIGTLPGTLERERATDDLIQGIDVFDTAGQLLYSTDRLRAQRPAPEAWMLAIKKAGEADWFVGDGNESAAGISVQNNFGLTVGYLALRYSEDRISDTVHAVGREMALAAFAVFVASSLLASFALVTIMGRLDKDVQTLEACLRGGTSVPAVAPRGPFQAVFQRFLDTVRAAEAQLAELRAQVGPTSSSPSSQIRGHKS
jgi:hypothetical protein